QLDELPGPSRARRPAALEPDRVPGRPLRRRCHLVAAAPGAGPGAARCARVYRVGSPPRAHRPVPGGLPRRVAHGRRRPAVGNRSAAGRRELRRRPGQLHHLAALRRDRRHPGEQLSRPGDARHPALQGPAPVDPAGLCDARPVRPGRQRRTGARADQGAGAGRDRDGAAGGPARPPPPAAGQPPAAAAPAPAQITPWEVLARPVSAGETMSWAEFLVALQPLPGSPFERLAELRAIMDRLALLPTAELDRLLTESLDTCSHRLDAWVT